tara:strand:+ start:5248 stop:5403 length:156 start_codon:yes stop_codon:yes gene_type:complete
MSKKQLKYLEDSRKVIKMYIEFSQNDTESDLWHKIDESVEKTILYYKLLTK